MNFNILLTLLYYQIKIVSFFQIIINYKFKNCLLNNITLKKGKNSKKFSLSKNSKEPNDMESENYKI